MDADLARLFDQWGRLVEARDIALGIPVDGRDATVLADLAAILLRGGDGTRADELASRALRMAPDDSHVARVRARVLSATGRSSEAVALHERMTSTDPGSVDAWMLRAEAHVQSVDLVSARACIDRVLALDSTHARAWEYLGTIEGLEDHLDEAVAALERAEALDGATKAGDAFVNQAVCLCNMGRWSEAVELLERELPSRPSANGHMTLGPALLVHGELEEGWRQYEFRWLSSSLAKGRPAYDRPAWDGQPLDGRTILVVAEQGIGDLIQFSRYFPLLRSRGAKVVVQIPTDVGGIAARLPGVDVPLREGEPLHSLDYFAFLLSLPRAFGTRLDTIPPCAPPLQPLPERSSKWRTRLGTHDLPRVGVVWAGSPKHLRDRHRSLRLDALLPVLSIPHVQFLGLQKGPATVQMEQLPETLRWESLGPELDDLEDAAAVLAEIDLLVTVDTGLAHLAATMNRPVWMLNGEPPDFRWLLSGEDTPWYPTMRMFRQTERGDWSGPVERLAAQLSGWANAWRSADDRAKPAPPAAMPTARAVPVGRHPRGLSRMAATRSGYIQYDPDEPDVGLSIEWLGEWLPGRLSLALALCAPGATVVEVGAGVGMHTIPIARAVGVRGRAVAYERRPVMRRMLMQNLAANHVSNVSVLTRDLVGEPTPGRDTIDDLGLDRLDGLVFADGEGAVVGIKGATETLWAERPWIVVGEEDEGHAVMLAANLRALGYRSWVQDAPLFMASNFNRREADPFEGRMARTLVAIPEERSIDANVPGGRELL